MKRFLVLPVPGMPACPAVLSCWVLPSMIVLVVLMAVLVPVLVSVLIVAWFVTLFIVTLVFVGMSVDVPVILSLVCQSFTRW